MLPRRTRARAVWWRYAARGWGRVRGPPPPPRTANESLTIATALYSAVCSQCYTRGLSWQADALAELNALRNTVSYRAVHHTRDIKRLQQPRQVSRQHSTGAPPTMGCPESSRSSPTHPAAPAAHKHTVGSGERTVVPRAHPNLTYRGAGCISSRLPSVVAAEGHVPNPQPRAA